MRNEWIEGFRRRLATDLQTLRKELEAERAEESSAHFRDLAGEVPDSAEAAMSAELVAAGNAEIGRIVSSIHEVEAALARITEGAFGVCTDCGQEIPAARLEAEPTA